MGEFTCADAHDAVAEAALGVLPDGTRGPFTAHLLRCPSCRSDFDSMSDVGRRLLELVPGTEPPLGFDRRVLASRPIGRRRFRLRVAAGAAAAAAAALIGLTSAGVFSSHSHSAGETARLTSDSKVVGTITVDPATQWVEMTIRGSTASGMVRCELLGPGKDVTDLGWFQLSDGSGSWGAPDSTGFSGVTGAMVVDASGGVVATARF